MKNPNQFSDMVVQAFKDTNTKPVCSVWFQKTGKKMSCCGLSALALKNNAVNKFWNELKKSEVAEDWSKQQFGVSFVFGFTRGFDGDSCSSENNAVRNGFNCGRLAAKKLGLLS